MGRSRIFCLVIGLFVLVAMGATTLTDFRGGMGPGGMGGRRGCRYQTSIGM